jgi:hypothetical protein
LMPSKWNDLFTFHSSLYPVPYRTNLIRYWGLLGYSSLSLSTHLLPVLFFINTIPVRLYLYGTGTCCTVLGPLSVYRYSSHRMLPLSSPPPGCPPAPPPTPLPSSCSQSRYRYFIL